MDILRAVPVLASILLIGCSEANGSPVGQWATGQGQTLIIDADGTFISRNGSRTVTGTWRITRPPNFILSPTGEALAFNGCYTGDGIKVDDGSLLMTMNRQNPDGTLQPRTTRSSVSLNGKPARETIHDCTP